MFDRRRQGHLIHRCYLTPAALFYGGKFSTTKANYAGVEELSAIFNGTMPISDFAYHRDGIIGIENGPGMESAMRTKSKMFFSGLFGLHTWVGREISSKSLSIIPEVMSDVLKGVRIIPNPSNFIIDPLPKNLGSGRKVMAEFGLTSGNMEGFPEDGFPYHTMLEGFGSRFNQLEEGDLMAFIFDCNQNGREVERSYNSYWTTLWARELLWVAKYELDIEGDFDPDSFYFRDIWGAESHGGFNYIYAGRPMNFSIGDNSYSITREDLWGITNSYKPPYETAEQLAHDLDAKLMDIFRSDGKRIAFPCLRK